MKNMKTMRNMKNNEEYWTYEESCTYDEYEEDKAIGCGDYEEHGAYGNMSRQLKKNLKHRKSVQKRTIP